MRIPVRILAFGLVAVTFGTVVPAVGAQQAGDGIIFVVVQGTEISILGEDDQGDKIIVVGRASETTDGGTCASGASFPIQSIVIVDPGKPGVRATRRADVVIISQDTPVSPGTRMTDLIAGSQCEIAGVTYDRYLGVVE